MATSAIETTVIPSRGGSITGLVRELLSRQPVLGWFALLSLACAALTTALMAFDARLIGDVSVWLKPTKFFVSMAVFIGTMAWFFGAIRPERRSSWLARSVIAVILVTAIFELVWITWQGAHGELSHFNFSGPFERAMFSLMGIAAVLLVATTLPMAWEIALRPAAGLDPAYRVAVILGLALTFALGGSLGGAIAANGGATVGPYASAVPLFAWNQIGGDLRVAHFFGMHAQQALPILAAMLIAVRARGRRATVALAAIAYAMVTLALWRQAVEGIPLIPA